MAKFVYFDAGGTLIEPHPSVGAIYSRAGAPHGLTATEKELQDAFRSAWMKHVEKNGDAPIRMGKDDETTHTWWRTLVDVVFDTVQFQGDRQACFRAFFDAFATRAAWRIFDDVLPTLRALEERGVRAGVLSNWDYRLPHLLEMLELSRFFDPVLVSALEGVAKPDRKFFAAACARVGLEPRDIVYVGDHTHLDLDPALAHGMRAFLIDRRGAKPGPHSIRSLVELVGAV